MDPEYGRRIVANGLLFQVQARIQFSDTMMAEMLYVAPGTYKQWIRNPGTRLWDETAVRVGRTYDDVIRILAEVREDRIPIDTMVPLHKVAMILGMPIEVLGTRWRAGDFDGVDLDLIGVWVPEVEVRRLQKERHHVAA